MELATFYDLADNNSEAAATQILDALIPRVFVEAPRKEDDEEYYDLFQRILHDPDAKNEKDYLRKVNIVSEQLLFLQFGMSGTTSMNARKPTLHRYQKGRCTNKKHEKIVVPTSNTKSATSL